MVSLRGFNRTIEFRGRNGWATADRFVVWSVPASELRAAYYYLDVFSKRIGSAAPVSFTGSFEALNNFLQEAQEELERAQVKPYNKP